MKRTITVVIGLILTFVLILLSVAARKHRWYSNQSNTYGWEIMTPEEQKDYHIKMQSFTGYDACNDFITDHNKKMEDRAKEKGVILPTIQNNPCVIMKNRHMFR